MMTLELRNSSYVPFEEEEEVDVDWEALELPFEVCLKTDVELTKEEIGERKQQYWQWATAEMKKKKMRVGTHTCNVASMYGIVMR